MEIKPTEEDYAKFKKLLDFFVKQWEENAQHQGSSGGNSIYGKTWEGGGFQRFNNFGFTLDTAKFDILKELSYDNIHFTFRQGLGWEQPGSNYLAVGWINIVPEFNIPNKKLVSFYTNICNSEAAVRNDSSGQIYLEFKRQCDKEHKEYKYKLDVKDVQAKGDKFFENFISIVKDFKEFERKYEKKEEKMAESEYIALLKNAKNLILTGAPGTGKTYLAKQIAMQMIFGNHAPKEKDLTEEQKKQFREQFEFVQFHPSYDYTDFVEGLRPINDKTSDEIGFRLKNGIFKEFCKNALVNFLNSKKPQEILSQEIEINNIVDKFIAKAIEDQCHYKTKGRASDFCITESQSNENRIYIDVGEKEPIYFSKKVLVKALIEKKDFTFLKEFTDEYNLSPNRSHSYLYAIYEEIKAELKQSNRENKNEIKADNKEKKFIFVIDEINRGEISKIFGELFFSIDPDYRGIDGKVKTQYANIQTEETKFTDDLEDGDFYVPENVYIIGTMNDIDRSVESFDFAMRRRFTWKEITAEQSAKNMRLSEEIKEKMTSLNNAISNIEGLNSSYHIGGAYFLKLENEDYSELWKYHLVPLLKEYLRGMSDTGTKLEELKNAYEKKTDANNG